MLRQHFFNIWLVSLLWLALVLPAPSVLAENPAAVSSTGSGQPLYFKETGHTLAYNFRVLWEKNGGLAILGFPITEVFMENGWPTQYFERARLEWHADARVVCDDEIIVFTGLQDRHYKVSEILTVKPDDSWVMGPSDNEQLTLITCVPYGVYTDFRL